jgi:hypothetical protein
MQDIIIKEIGGWLIIFTVRGFPVGILHSGRCPSARF